MPNISGLGRVDVPDFTSQVQKSSTGGLNETIVAIKNKPMDEQLGAGITANIETPISPEANRFPIEAKADGVSGENSKTSSSELSVTGGASEETPPKAAELIAKSQAEDMAQSEVADGQMEEFEMEELEMEELELPDYEEKIIPVEEVEDVFDLEKATEVSSEVLKDTGWAESKELSAEIVQTGFTNTASKHAESLIVDQDDDEEKARMLEQTINDLNEQFPNLSKELLGKLAEAGFTLDRQLGQNLSRLPAVAEIETGSNTAQLGLDKVMSYCDTIIRHKGIRKELMGEQSRLMAEFGGKSPKYEAQIVVSGFEISSAMKYICRAGGVPMPSPLPDKNSALVQERTHKAEDLYSMLGEDNIPSEFICPITRSLISVPVALHMGNGKIRLFERDALKTWFEIKRTNPLTREQYPEEMDVDDIYMYSEDATERLWDWQDHHHEKFCKKHNLSNQTEINEMLTKLEIEETERAREQREKQRASVLTAAGSLAGNLRGRG